MLTLFSPGETVKPQTSAFELAPAVTAKSFRGSCRNGTARGNGFVIQTNMARFMAGHTLATRTFKKPPS